MKKRLPNWLSNALLVLVLAGVIIVVLWLAKLANDRDCNPATQLDHYGQRCSVPTY